MQERTEMKLVKVLAVLAIVALMGQAVGPAPVQAQAKIIKIASQSPLSGGQSVLGTAIRNGVDLAIQQLKKPLEDAGFTIQFVPFDDQATPDVGTANANNIINDPAILAVVGHLNSGVALPSSEVYDKAGLTMVSPANTNVNITDRGLATVNRICGRDDAQAEVAAEFVFSQLKPKTLYIIHDKTAYGQGVAEFLRTNAQKAGVEVLGFEGTEEKSNFDAIITPILAQSPDVIFFGGIYDQAGPFFKQAREKGVKSAFTGPDGMDSSDLAKIGGESVVGMVYTTAAGVGTKQFIDDYQAAFKLFPDPYAAEGYASTQIVLNAILQLTKATPGTVPTRAQVAAAVRGTKDFETIMGKITFDKNGDPEMATYYFKKVTSADPMKWGGNEVLSTATRPSPLMKAAAATPAATQAK
jgi:branched-chain amino acid transport system substrate-binding protein